MQEQELVSVFSNFAKPQEFSLLQELVSATEKRLYESWYLLVLSCTFRDFRAIIKSLFALLDKECEKKAKVSKLKEFKGSREQEIEILHAFWLKKEMAKMPEWFKEEVWKI